MEWNTETATAALVVGALLVLVLVYRLNGSTRSITTS